MKKLKLMVAVWLIAAGLLSSRNALAQIVFTYATNNGAVTLTGYTGSISDVTNVIVPGFVNIIGEGSLQDSQNLTNVVIPNSVTNIGPYAFNNCSSLTNFTLLPGNPALAVTNRAICTSNFTEIIIYPAGSQATSFAVPNGVKNIRDSAFDATYYLQTVTFPPTLTNIGSYAFGFSGLTSVIVPNGVVSIGQGAFADSSISSLALPATATNIAPDIASSCYGLASINVNSLNPAYASAAGVLFDHGLITLLQYPSGKTDGQYAIPQGVTNIAQDAFFQTQVTNIILPASLTSIPQYAFNAAVSLTTMMIPSTVTNIANSAFWQCSGLQTIYFANGIQNLAPYAFTQDTSLTGVFFEGNAPAADCTTFFDDSLLTAVYYLPGTNVWGSTFACLPAINWAAPVPRISSAGAEFQPGQFSFNLTGSSNAVLTVQSSSDLSNWTSIGTVTLSSGAASFVDTTTYTNRFYRLHIP